MNYDFYSEIDKLCSILVDENFDDWSDEITLEIKSSSTGTEIIMRVNWVLGKLLKEETKLRSSTVKMIQSIRSNIEIMLN